MAPGREDECAFKLLAREQEQKSSILHWQVQKIAETLFEATSI